MFRPRKSESCPILGLPGTFRGACGRLSVMSTISVQEIERDPAEFLHRVVAGEAILVVDGQVVVAEVKPLGSRGIDQRPWGLAAGEFAVPDDFDAPLSDDVLNDFEGR